MQKLQPKHGRGGKGGGGRRQFCAQNCIKTIEGRRRQGGSKIRVPKLGNNSLSWAPPTKKFCLYCAKYRGWGRRVGAVGNFKVQNRFY